MAAKEKAVEVSSVPAVQSQGPSRADLIITALKEQVSEQSVQLAIFRADITILSNENQALRAELEAAHYAATLPK